MLAVIAWLGMAFLQAAQATSPSMTFFVTSTGRGFGGNLGGIEGADRRCQVLAESVGAGGRTWRAYLSVPAREGRPAQHARDRIGKGPWVNAHGVQIAADLEELHTDNNAVNVETVLTEKGVRLSPERHDILTGSNPDGTLATNAADTTCYGWTSHQGGRAMLGHHNRYGGGQRPTSWNSAHISRGCSQRELRASLGDGLTYCFAAD